MARARLLDVSRDERRPIGGGRALRRDLEPQLRRPPGRGRAYAPRESGEGRGGGGGGAVRRRARLELNVIEAGRVGRGFAPQLTNVSRGIERHWRIF